MQEAVGLPDRTGKVFRGPSVLQDLRGTGVLQGIGGHRGVPVVVTARLAPPVPAAVVVLLLVVGVEGRVLRSREGGALIVAGVVGLLLARLGPFSVFRLTPQIFRPSE